MKHIKLDGVNNPAAKEQTLRDAIKDNCCIMRHNFLRETLLLYAKSKIYASMW